MKKNKILKTLGLFGCAILLVAVSIAGTMAYMTSTAEVKNTFTVGSVSITMDETKVDLYGNALTGDDAGRGNANTYKLIPGHSYTKNPIVHVAAGSEECYLFVKVENGIDAIDGDTISTQLNTNGWTALTDATKATNVYTHAAVNALNGAVDVPVFESFTITDDAAVANYKDAEVKVTAYAVQKDGFDSAAEAWNATFGK